MKKIVSVVLGGFVVITCIPNSYAQAFTTAPKAAITAPKVAIATQEVTINNQLMLPKPTLIKVGKEVLIPIRSIATAMGSPSVSWNNKTHTVTIEVKDFIKAHEYLSYLNGLANGTKENEYGYPLPERLRKLDLPPYPLYNSNAPMIHQTPIELDIVSGESKMPWAVYDYVLKEGTLYMGADWLNTLFLAQIQETPNQLIITYPISEELEKKVSDLEKLAMPISPEEAVALWARGQERRSGAIQYVALSPHLKEEAMKYVQSNGWVTGGSSPSFDNPVITAIPSKDTGSYSFEIRFEQRGGGMPTIEGKQIVVVKPYEIEGKVYWLISDVAGDLEYYAILQGK